MLPDLIPTNIHFAPTDVNGSRMAVTVEHPKFTARSITHQVKVKVIVKVKVNVKVKVKCTLVQALRLCSGRTAHRGSRVIALPFHDHGTRRG